jgi:hypothetical protein
MAISLWHLLSVHLRNLGDRGASTITLARCRVGETCPIVFAFDADLFRSVSGLIGYIDELITPKHVGASMHFSCAKAPSKPERPSLV